LRLLFADDNVDHVSIVRMLAHEFGMLHQGVNRGDLVIAEVEVFDPHILLLDLSMPGMSGYEVSIALRKAGRHDLVLIAYSAFASDADKAASNSAGFDHHLVKTAEPRELIQLLQACAAKL
jgi:CheY-like chemotaxis protein